MEACSRSISSRSRSYSPFSTWNECRCATMMALSLSQLYWQSDHAAVALCRPAFPSHLQREHTSVFFSLLAGLLSQRKWGFSRPAFFSFFFLATFELKFLPKTFLLNIISKHLIDQQSATFTNKYYHQDENELSMWGFQTSYWDLLKCGVLSFQRNNIA